VALTIDGRFKLTTVNRNYILVVKLFMVILFLSAKCGQALRLLHLFISSFEISFKEKKVV